MKFLQSVDVIKYTDEEYEKLLMDPVSVKLCRQIFVVDYLFFLSLIFWWPIRGWKRLFSSYFWWAIYFWIWQKWSKEETDQLFDMCQRFDLRFVVIADRFPSSRSVEELKHRYYSGNLIHYFLLTSDISSISRSHEWILTSILLVFVLCS